MTSSRWPARLWGEPGRRAKRGAGRQERQGPGAPAPGLPLLVVSIAVDQQHRAAQAAQQRRVIAVDEGLQQSGAGHDRRPGAVLVLGHGDAAGALQLVAFAPR